VFGDQLNAINISGIIVIFMGVLLYKVSLHLNHQRETLSADIEIDAEFSQVHGDDDYENESSPPKNFKRLQKNSDPDLSSMITMYEDEIGEKVCRDFTKINSRNASPNSSNRNLEVQGGGKIEDDDGLLLV